MVRKKSSVGYWAALQLVTIAMLVLFTSYLLFVLALVGAYLVYLVGVPIYIFQNVLDTDFIGISIALYALGLVVFTIVLLVALAAHFYPHAAVESVDKLLDQKKYKEIYDLSSHIAREIGAPEPINIVLRMNVTASASFDGGMFSLLLGRMRLSIGLPLIEVMTERELAGVIAHELGHFAQRTGMRMIVLIKRINSLFFYIVYARDGWDDWLLNAVKQWGFMLFVPATIIGLRWIYRKVLTPFFWLSHLITLNLSRQMEYDADQCMAIVVGKDSVEDTLRLVRLLALADQVTRGEVQRLWTEREQLVESFPELMEGCIERLPPELLESVEEEFSKEKTRLFDTHPAMRYRIARVQSMESEGIPFEEREARTLIPEYEKLAREMTQQLYKIWLGDKYQESAVMKAADIKESRRRERSQSESLERYFQSLYSFPLIPLVHRIPPLKAPTEVESMLAQMEEARERLISYSSILKKDLKTFVDCASNVFRAEACIVLIRADLDPELVVEERKLHNRARCQAYIREQNLEKNRAHETIQQFEKENQLRFVSALRIATLPDIHPLLRDKGIKVERMQSLLNDLDSVSFVMDLVRELRGRVIILALLLEYMHETRDKENQGLVYRLHEYVKLVHQQINSVLTPLKNHQYPFEHSAGSITMAQYALPEVPHPYDLQAVFNGADRMMSNIHTLYFQIFGTLAEIAEGVEEIYGMEKLPIPEWDDNEEEEEEDDSV